MTRTSQTSQKRPFTLDDYSDAVYYRELVILFYRVIIVLVKAGIRMADNRGISGATCRQIADDTE